MARQPDEVNPTRRIAPRESDNPIAEDFKEELLRRPSIGPRSIITSDAQRLTRLEGTTADLHERIKALEHRIELLEKKKK